MRPRRQCRLGLKTTPDKRDGRKEIECRKCKHDRHGLGKNVVLCSAVFCTTQWMQRHTTSHLEDKRGDGNSSREGGCYQYWTQYTIQYTRPGPRSSPCPSPFLGDKPGS
jgi:hypothetical protein